MIDLYKMRKDVSKGLKEHTGVPVIRGNQTASTPSFPFISYNVTTIATENNGTYQQHEDGIDRLMVRSIWSITSHSQDWDESVQLATKAREWFLHTGRTWLAEREIVVQSATQINNRDNLLTVEYERKNGFDVVFYVYDEAESPSKTTGYIEGAQIAHEMTN